MVRLERFVIACAVFAAIVPNILAQEVRVLSGADVSQSRGIVQASWYGESAIRVIPPQEKVDRLDYAFLGRWAPYDWALGELGSLGNAERIAGTEQLSRAFYQDFTQVANCILPLPERGQYIQFGIQNCFYNPFTDPNVIAGLCLGTQQREQFLRIGHEYNLRMDQITQRVGTVPWNEQQPGHDLHLTIAYQVDTILGERQRKQWQEMVGPRYDYPTDVRVFRR
jgi:hypothetical protein